MICEWWFKVNCTNSPNLYDESAEQWRNSVIRRKASRRVLVNGEINHGAVLRTEEQSSVRAMKNGKHVEFNVERHETNHAEQRQRTSSNYRPPPKNKVNRRIENNYQNVNEFNGNNNGNNIERNYDVGNNLDTSSGGKVRISAGRSGQSSKKINGGNSGKIKLTLNSVNNAVTINGQHVTQPLQKTSKKSENKNIKLTLSSVNNQVSFGTNQSPKINNNATQQNIGSSKNNYNENVNFESGQQNNQNDELNNKNNKQKNTASSNFNDDGSVKASQKQRTIPTNRGGFKYNQEKTSEVTYNPSTTNAPVSVQTFRENTDNTPELIAKTDVPKVHVTSEATNYFISSTTNPLSINTLSDNSKNYDLQFPQHASEKQKESKLEVEVKGEVKQKSTVPLTINDITNRRVEPSDSDESQITQESSSFIKSALNTIQNSYKSSTTNPYPNHRTTYSDLKSPSYTSTKYLSTINSVTPQYLTTQPINNGKPFVGSRVGVTIPGIITVNPTASYVSTESSDGDKFPLFNVGQTRKELPITTTTTAVPSTTISLPSTGLFNLGNTDFTIKPVPFTTPAPDDIYGKESLSLFVPDKFNLGLNRTQFSKYTQNQSQIGKGLFNLGLGKINVSQEGTVLTPQKPVDHQVVYGTFNKVIHTTTPPSFDINKGVQIKFDKNSNKVGIQLSKTISGASQSLINAVTTSSSSTKTTSGVSQSLINAVTTSSSINPDINNNGGSNILRGSSQSGFFVTRDSASSTTSSPLSINSISDNSISTTAVPLSTQGFSLNAESSKYYGKDVVQKPRPFEKSSDDVSSTFSIGKSSTENSIFNSVTPTFPTYKISTASPFVPSQDVKSTSAPTVPTPFDGTFTTSQNSIYDNVDNMINVLKEIAKAGGTDYENETPRPGLVVPPSVGPQTLHTLAVYFANALDGIAAEKEKNGNNENDDEEEDKYEAAKQSLTALLTKMTVNKYNELFDEKDNSTETVTVASRINDDDEGKYGLQTDNSNHFNNTPHIRQLAKNFSIALSSYLDDPQTFRKNLEQLRPTEPPQSSEVEVSTENSGNDEELLNFSDADSKSSYPPFYPTLPSAKPTWGYILAYNVSKESNHNLDVKNSLNPDLQGADSQSFVPRFNNINSDVKDSKNTLLIKSQTSQTDLPPNHWTSSPQATKLWKTTFSVNPVSLNQHLGTTPVSLTTEDDKNSGEDFTESLTSEADVSSLEQPHHEIKYELRQLPQLTLNSTQVHGILIDFMNTTKSDDDNRLQRILHKLNTTETEFLSKMKEIESNPLTKRLILLLISECGASITKDLESGALSVSTENDSASKQYPEPLSVKSPISIRNTQEGTVTSNSNIPQLIDPSISEEDHDARALQLLNSLYTIASRFGK